jgi:hypothetical protein
VSDLYGAITDSAVNRIVRLLMTWRPPLFNYVAPSQFLYVGADPAMVGFGERWLVCSPVAVPPGMDASIFPRYTRRPPLKVPGLPGGGAPYCVQITDVKIDFQPSNEIALPPDLSPPLGDQRFAVWARASAGIGCPSDALVDALLSTRFERSAAYLPYHDLFSRLALDVTSLICFSLEAFAVGHLYTDTQPGTSNPPVTRIRVALDAVEVKDLMPTGLEEAAECYLRMLIRGYVLPELVLAVEPIVAEVLGLTLKVVPTLSAGPPHNPAVEQNELRVWLDVDI